MFEQHFVPLAARFEDEIAPRRLDDAQLNPEAFGRQHGVDVFRPLDDDRAAPVEDVVDANRFGGNGAVQTVAIEMEEDLRVLLALVLVDEVESRAGERRFNTPALADADGEGGFARAEIAREADDIAGLQERAKANTKPARLLGAVADDVEFAFPQDWHARPPVT